MAIEKDFTVNFKGDSSGLSGAVRAATSSFTEFNQALEVIQKGVALAQSAFQALGASVERGQAFTELKTAFDQLYGSSKILADDGLGTLREAVDGTISDLDLLAKANQAAATGITAEAFLELAQAAETLGDQVGKTANESLGDLVNAMTTGRDIALRYYGITIDNAKANKELAESLDKPVEALTELERLEATRAAIREQVISSTEGAASANQTVGDSLERLSVLYDNAITQISTAINTNEKLAAVLAQVQERVAAIDWTPIISGLATVIELIIRSVEKWALFLQYVGFSGQEAETLEEQLDEVGGALAEVDSQLASVNELLEANIVLGRDDAKATKEALEAKKELLQTQAANLQRQLANAAAYDKTSEALDRMKTSAEEAAGKTESRGISAISKEATKATEEVGKLVSTLNELPQTPEIISAQIVQEPVQAGLEDAFQESVDFFETIFSNALSGSALDFESSFRQVAVNISAQLAASISESLTSGLGIGGGDGFLSGLFDSASGFLDSIGLGSLDLAGIFGDVISSGISFGLGELINSLEGTFGGTTNKETLARREFRDQLTKFFGDDLLVPTVQGNVSLTGVDFGNFQNFINTNPLGNEATGFASGIANAITGGGKLGEDFTAIFAQIIGQADNFNEVLVNSLAIMDKLGLSAEEAKESLKEAFLEGKIELDEFGVGVANLNLIAQNDLIGPNSVADAIKILSENLDNPRIALKGLELAFKEMAELGVDSVGEIRAYLMEKFGPDVAAVFDQITALGIDTWEEVKNANVDQIYAIFQALAGLEQQVSTTFRGIAQDVTQTMSEAGADASEAFIESTEPLFTHADILNEKWRNTADNIRDSIKDIINASQSANAAALGNGSTAPTTNGSELNNPFRA